jgi:hypothetical protein
MYCKKIVERYILFFLLLLSVLLLPACQNDGSRNTSQKNTVSNSDSVYIDHPTIRFDTTAYDFGRVYEGEMVGWYFKYKNIGSKNLVLLNVTAGCGCTTPEYSAEPLAPGAEGKIKVVFNSKGRSGHQYKTVSVESNGEPGTIELVITAEIIEKNKLN